MPYFHMSDEGVWSRVSKPNGENGCWLWLGGKGFMGYGKLNRYGKSVYAHRLIWALTNKVEVPPSTAIFMHTCDKTGCVNPGHMRIGTRRDNAHDRDGKTRQARGERCGSAKLTEALVREAKELYATGMSAAIIAKRFGVGRVAISNVVAGRTWRHVL